MDPRRWSQPRAAELGGAFIQALENLEQGKEGAVDVALGNRLIRMVNDLINGRLVVFELTGPARGGLEGSEVDFLARGKRKGEA